MRYQVQEPLLDFTKAKGNPIVVHPEENFRTLCDVGTDASRNLCSTEQSEVGDVEAELAASEVVLTRTYHTKANSQSMMETFRTFCYLDEYSRLCVVSLPRCRSMCACILSNALEMKKADIRVIKPRIGGGFGAKQSSVSEVFPAFVTRMTGDRPIWNTPARRPDQRFAPA